MTMKIDIRSIESPVASEVYISAVPTACAPLRDNVREIFSGISGELRSRKAGILQERIFATADVMETICRIRSEVYGELDDGVAPSLLVCKPTAARPIAGVQVHAVIAESRPEVVDFQGTACGRIVRVAGRSYLTLSGVSAEQSSNLAEQAGIVFEKASSILKQFGLDFHSVPRTWMWLGDILSWYDDFNRVRNNFFVEHGLVVETEPKSMPASTGIGLALADGSKCAMDLAAVVEPQNSIQYLDIAGRQHCAFEYGSAFSRACRAVTLAGQTVFVSGTASIDAVGATTHIGDPTAQINATIENVQAVLKDLKCADDEVVQAIAYCKTTEVERIFNSLKAQLPWPWITVICDICRPELLFEIEATSLSPNP